MSTRKVGTEVSRNGKKNNESKGPVKGIFAVVIVAIMVLAYFYIINNRIKSVEKDVDRISPVQELLVQDLSGNYPATPKEVVKMYGEITRCFYAEEYSDEELTALALMSRQLFDDELVANQTDEAYIRALKGEIANYKKMNRVISSVSVSSGADVQYYNYEGDEWAQLIAMYSIRTGTKIEPSKERFLLRKDEAGHWKIYGFRLEELNHGGGGTQ